MQIGDSFWWQCGVCYWTPKANANSDYRLKDGVDYDIGLKKIGYSH
jgi:hypothetical protein